VYVDDADEMLSVALRYPKLFVFNQKPEMFDAMIQPIE